MSQSESQYTTEGTTPGQRHWVEDLFPPHFQLSLSDLTREPQQADEGTQEAWRLAQRKKAKDIYHQVKARMDSEAQIPKDKNIQVGEPLSELKQNVKLTGKVKRSESSKKKEIRDHGGDGERTEDGGIWSKGEIEILRKEFQKVREEKQILHIELKALQRHYKDLEKKHKEQTELLNTKAKALKEAHQQNQRLHLQTQHLTKEVRLQMSKLAMAEDDYREVVEQRMTMRKDAVDLRKALSRTKHDLKEVTIQLSEADSRHRLESMEKEETMRLEYESQIAALYQELSECRTELEKERMEHKRSSKALELLRIHFAQQSERAEPKHSTTGDAKSFKVLQLY
nr:coiled-coil domain-containing protein 160 homolog [Lytechinus pictus]